VIMRIGINLLYLIPGIVGGTERYAAGLLHGLNQLDLKDEFVVFLNRQAASWPLPAAANFEKVVCSVDGRQRAWRYAFEQLRLPALLKSANVSLVHSLGYVGPLYPPCPALVTVPDLNYAQIGFQMTLTRRWMLRFFVHRAAVRSRRVITISQHAAREIRSAFGFPEDRVVVTYLAALPSCAEVPNTGGRLEEFRKPWDPYLVAFTSPSPHKNISRLIEAFRQAKETYDLSHHLVLIGHLPRFGLPHPLPSDIHCTGYLPRGEVDALLRGAQLMVFPSVYEGFGLPVLEAMSAGVPVACSRAASLPEVAGDAALFFNPLSIDEMADRIARLAVDSALRQELRLKGAANAGRFSWEQTAHRTVEVYRSLNNAGE
jgi:glycosyltransferase involved in cell wall biosynthesis